MATNVLIEASDAAALFASGGSAEMIKSLTPPTDPKPGDQWLDTSVGVSTSIWPIRVFIEGEWIKQGEYNNINDTLSYEGVQSIQAGEITRSSSQPSSPSEGDVWWEPSGQELIQHVYLNAAWQQTGTSFDTATGQYKPILLGSGLNFASNGAVSATSGATGTGGFAAGDVVISFDDPLPDTMIELNGALVATGTTRYPGICTRYPWMVRGTGLYLPDCRGMILRHLDRFASRDPDANSRIGRAGDNLGGAVVGSYQLDSIGPHTHDVAVNYVQASALGAAPDDLALGQYNSVGGPISDGSTRVQSNGTGETRMKNVAIRYCMIAG